MKLTGPITEKRKGEITVALDSREDRLLCLSFQERRSICIGDLYQEFVKLGFKNAVRVVRGRVNLATSIVIYGVREVK